MDNVSLNQLRVLLAQTIATACRELYDAVPKAIEIVPPPDTRHGDLAFAAFKAASDLNVESPVELAEAIASKMAWPDVVEKVSSIGPYVNFHLNRAMISAEVIGNVLHFGDNYGSSIDGRGKTVVIDFSHPNIAKPFHIGHLRSTNLGAAISRILTFSGYSVFRKNYLGDWGTQFGFVIHGWKEYGDENALTRDAINHLVSLYIKANADAKEDSNVREAARKYFQLLEKGDLEIRGLWERFRRLSLEAYKKTYERLDISFDSYEGEASIGPRVESVVNRFLDSGVACESDGAVVVAVDDVIGREISPCMLQKSDGSTTYAARDCAEAIKRFEDHAFNANLYVVARQGDHFTQVFAALHKLALAENWPIDWTNRCEVVEFGFFRGMSTRMGEVVWLSDVLDEAKARAADVWQQRVANYPKALPDVSESELESISEAVGQAAVRFFDVSARRHKEVSFNWDAVLKFEGDTGPYLQYTYARTVAIVRKAVVVLDIQDVGAQLEVDRVADNSEAFWRVVFLLMQYPECIATAARQREPSTVAEYAIRIASEFNGLYGACRIVDRTDIQTSKERVALTRCVQTVLRSTMRLLGIRVLDRM